MAYPVGTDRPAKRQKKTSCVSTGRSVRSTSALARWRVVLPSCLDRVTSWHLFRLARTIDRVSVPSPIAIDMLMDTMARDRAHMYWFSV